MLRYLLIFLFYFTTGVSEAFSQDTAFNRLDVSISAAQTLSDNNLTKSWNLGPSLKFSFNTPFYAGMLEGGIRYSRFSNSQESPSYSDFHSTFIYLGWGYLFNFAKKFSVGPVIRFGNTLFLYDQVKIYPSSDAAFTYDFDTEESEFTYELFLRNQYQISKRWKVHTGLALNRVLTYHPLQLTFVNLGFTYSFDSPSWFQKVFK